MPSNQTGEAYSCGKDSTSPLTGGTLDLLGTSHPDDDAYGGALNARAHLFRVLPNEGREKVVEQKPAGLPGFLQGSQRSAQGDMQGRLPLGNWPLHSGPLAKGLDSSWGMTKWSGLQELKIRPREELNELEGYSQCSAERSKHLADTNNKICVLGCGMRSLI